jgi:hypothetical protein
MPVCEICHSSSPEDILVKSPWLCQHNYHIRCMRTMNDDGYYPYCPVCREIGTIVDQQQSFVYQGDYSYNESLYCFFCIQIMLSVMVTVCTVTIIELLDIY